MIEKLVAFGCSWTFGDELDNPELAEFKEDSKYWDMNAEYRVAHSYPGLIAKHYNLEVENLAFPGASLNSIRDTLIWYIANNDISNTMFLLGLTEAWRCSWNNSAHERDFNDPEWNTHIHSSWLLHNDCIYDESWKETFRNYVDNQVDDTLRWRNLNETLMLFDGVSARFQIPVIQFNMLEVIENSIPVPTYAWPLEEMRNYIQTQAGRAAFAPGRHPNEKGHEIISKRLIDYIDSAKLLEC